MRHVEGREPDVLTGLRRHSRPVVSQGDLGLGGADRPEVVSPKPSAELKIGVVRTLARLPGDGIRGVEYLDAVRHLVVLIGVVLVVHRYAENLPDFGQALTVQ